MPRLFLCNEGPEHLKCTSENKNSEICHKKTLGDKASSLRLSKLVIGIKADAAGIGTPASGQSERSP
jgi:hypothetical protein